MEKCLSVLKNSNSDNEKFAALLLVSDIGRGSEYCHSVIHFLYDPHVALAASLARAGCEVDQVRPGGRRLQEEDIRQRGILLHKPFADQHRGASGLRPERVSLTRSYPPRLLQHRPGARPAPAGGGEDDSCGGSARREVGHSQHGG